jgi:hypothetical protein
MNRFTLGAGTLLWLAASGAAFAQDAPAAAAAASAASAAASAARPAADPTAPKPFTEVIRGATRQDGLVPIWRKDERVWLEIPRELVGRPLLFTANIANSVGERGLYASQMGVSQLAQIRVVGRQVQLLAINTKFRADAGAGGSRAVEQAFSPSLLASGVVASQEHPERKSVLVDAGMLLTDIPGYSTRLEMAFRLPFSLDRPNSSFERLRAEPKLTTLTARMHFATARIPAPPLTPSPAGAPTPPQATPDPRSLFVDFVYSLKALPEAPMAARHADPRLGHFTESFTDLGGDAKANPRMHYVRRWRLEKQDPSAALSEPVQPIVFWMDKNIPVKYRPAVESGVLEWNKAFAKIGFKDAIVVKQQPDDADWDNMDAGHASIRWFVGADVGFAIGPSHADPRSGEILDADIGMSDVFARGSRRTFVEDIGRKAQAMGLSPEAAAYLCQDADFAAADTQFALELLDAREELAPDSPEAEAFVNDAIRGTIMHEVGHVLGLKHNFKGSTAITPSQLQDMTYTKVNSISNSVMDYTPVNLATKGEKQGAFMRTTLGAYDYWAIEYAYRPVDPAREPEELARIAARNTEPLLAYADDADAGGLGDGQGMDPLSNRFDLGSDPLGYYRKRFALSRELWERVQERGARAGDDPLRPRRGLMAGFAQLPAMAELAAKYIGGMNAVRDLPGTTQRAAFQPVDPAQQRDALSFLVRDVFSVESFRFKPEFLTSLTVDYNEWDRGGPADIPAAVARVQNSALERVMSAGTAKRMLDLPLFVPEANRKGLISLGEVYETVQKSVWSELAAGQEIDRMRRTLQREHLKRVQMLLVRPPANMPADAVSLVRYNATKLQEQLRLAVAKSSGRSLETRAHLAESLATLTEALRATMQRG